MADASFTQSSFLGGEFSPYAQGRIDLPVYKAAMNVCRNGLPIEEGAWQRRSGTRYAGTTYKGNPGRLINFDFEEVSPYLMEFTDSALRMYTTQSGAFGLVTTNDDQVVVSISTANPAVVQTTTADGWLTNDEVVFKQSGVAGGFCPTLFNRTFTITVVDTTHFSLKDSLTGATIDGSTLGWGAHSGTVSVARVLRIVTPYASGAWGTPYLRHVQAETNSILLNASYQPRTLSVVALPTSSTFATFSMATQTFSDGPYLDPLTDGSTVTVSSLTLYQPNPLMYTGVFTFSSIANINGGAGFTTADVGRCVRIFSEPPNWASGTAYTVGQYVSYGGAYFKCISNSTGNEPDIAPTYWSISTTAAIWAWATITNLSSTSVVNVLIRGSVPYATITPGSYVPVTITTWRLGVYGGTNGWPTCGLYYEGRLWLAGAVANRVDCSVSNSIFDFSPTDDYGNVADNNGISYVFDTDEVNPIYWMVGTQTGIIAGTLGGEWVIQASTLANPVTPTSIQAHRVTTYGCYNVEPAHSDLTIAIVHKYQRKLLEYFPDVFTGRYTAPNLSHFAKHLTVSGIEEVQYQKELAPVIWARCADGSLIGATYKRTSLFSSQGPEFIGWHRHDFGDARLVESIAVGPSVDGTLDALAMVVNDPDSSVRSVVLMQKLFEVNADIKTGWFVDSGIVPSGGVIDSSNNVTFGGLYALNRSPTPYTVTVWVGGIDCGDYTVTNSQVVVPIDVTATALFSTAYLSSISASTYGAMAVSIYDQRNSTSYTVPVVVGFTYTSQGQILRPDTVEQLRSPTGPGQAKPRRTHQFGVLLAGSQGVSFGTNFTTMHAAKFKSAGGTVPLTLLQLYSGVYWETLDDTWSFDSMIAWQVTRPYPCAVASITQFINSVDR